jgi:hypothetical protein
VGVTRIPGTRQKLDDALFGDSTRSLVLVDRWRPEYTQLMRDHGLTGISLNRAHGWDGDAGFLSDLAEVRAVHVLWWGEPLHDLVLPQAVEQLALDAPMHGDARVRGSGALEDLRFTFARPFVDLVNAEDGLRSVHVARCPQEGLMDLCAALPQSVAELGLRGGPITGVSPFRVTRAKLERLTLSRLRSCTDYLLPECQAMNDLRYLEIDGSSRFVSLEALRHVSLSIVELALENCPRLHGLDELRGCPRLQGLYLHGTTSVKSGDLHPALDALGLQRLFISPWRRHYRPSVSELRQARPDLELLP